VRSVLLCSGAGVIGILAAIKAPQSVFAFLVDASGALMVFVYGLIALAHLRMRRRRERAGEPAPALTMWLFPWSSYLAIGAMLAILIAMQFTPGLGADLHVSLISLVVVSCAYLGLRAWRGAHVAAATDGQDEGEPSRLKPVNDRGEA
jgi:AAT family amino acid transporter/GABA permease